MAAITYARANGGPTCEIDGYADYARQQAPAGSTLRGCGSVISQPHDLMGSRSMSGKSDWKDQLEELGVHSIGVDNEDK